MEPTADALPDPDVEYDAGAATGRTLDGGHSERFPQWSDDGNGLWVPTGDGASSPLDLWDASWQLSLILFRSAIVLHERLPAVWGADEQQRTRDSFLYGMRVVDRGV